MSEFNRRDFIKLSAAGAVAASVPETVQAMSTETPKGDISVWVTGGDKRHSKAQPLKWGATAPSGASDVIVVDASRRFQQMLGFGAAFTDAACFTLNRLSPEVRKQLFHDWFDPSQLGLSVSRVCMGASDYSTKVYSYSEGTEPDLDLKRFSIDHDKAYILPILREARAVCPDMWILGTPWSPPAWMKFNLSMLGGSMRHKYLGVYADYFTKFLDAYAAAGVKVNSVTPQNEIDTDQDGRMPACCWPQEYEIEFIRDFLGPKMTTAANPADIWILDHNYNLWGRVLDELEEEKMRRVVKGVAWHGYVGTPDMMTRVQKVYPNMPQFWTEGGPDFEQPGYETEWTKFATQFTGILRNNAKSIIAWNYALDERGKPNVGPFFCAGMVTVDSKTAAITHSGQYWAFAHFSSHIRRGAHIISSASDQSGSPDAAQHVVALNPDGSYAAVLTNASMSAREVDLRVGSTSVRVTLAPDTVTTLTWS